MSGPHPAHTGCKVSPVGEKAAEGPGSLTKGSLPPHNPTICTACPVLCPQTFLYARIWVWVTASDVSCPRS